jgi:hypothetical protein
MVGRSICMRQRVSMFDVRFRGEEEEEWMYWGAMYILQDV